MEHAAIEAVKLQVNEAIRLLKEFREGEALAIIDGILAEMREPPIRISGRTTTEETIWYWLGEARKGLTIDPGEPVIAHLETLFRYLGE